jgi:hypothetical protein
MRHPWYPLGPGGAGLRLVETRTQTYSFEILKYLAL